MTHEHDYAPVTQGGHGEDQRARLDWSQCRICGASDRPEGVRPKRSGVLSGEPTHTVEITETVSAGDEI